MPLAWKFEVVKVQENVKLQTKKANSTPLVM